MHVLYVHMHVRIFKVGLINVFEGPLISFSENSFLKDICFFGNVVPNVVPVELWLNCSCVGCQ